MRSTIRWGPDSKQALGSQLGDKMAEFIVDSLFPAHRINLIGGQSNVGKTRWILPTMIQWSKGVPIMGFPSHPRPWAYVSGDRQLVEAQDSIKDLGLSTSDVPIIGAFGIHNKSWQSVLRTAAQMKVEVLVWEGFGDLAPDPQRRTQVRDFLSEISAHCPPCPADFPNGLTIQGIMESPKMKPYERYRNPRERISGVASWGYHTSTVVLIEHGDPANQGDPHRVLYASLKLAPSFTSLGTFTDTGLLSFGLPETIEIMSGEDLDMASDATQRFLEEEKARKSLKIS